MSWKTELPCRAASGLPSRLLFFNSAWVGQVLAAAIFTLGGATTLQASELALIPEETPVALFCGKEQTLHVRFLNGTDTSAKANLRTRLFQLSSSTLMPLSESKPWKTLELLPRQTAVEKITLSLPAVRAATRFNLTCLDEGNRMIGQVEIIGYPSGVLQRLRTVTGEGVLGVLEPDGQLKKLLKESKLEFEDLNDSTDLARFQGKLAIVGPFSSPAQMTEDITRTVSERARKGLALVWIQPPNAHLPLLAPSAYMVKMEGGVVVVAQAATAANLSESPLAQLNLVRFAGWALAPDSLQLPQISR